MKPQNNKNTFSGIAIVLSSYPAPSGKFIHYYTKDFGTISVLKRISSSKPSYTSAGSLFSIEKIEAKKYKDFYILQHSEIIKSFTYVNSILHMYICSIFSEIIEKDFKEPEPIIFYNLFNLLSKYEEKNNFFAFYLFIVLILIRLSGWEAEIIQEQSNNVIAFLSKIKDINKCSGIHIEKSVFRDSFINLLEYYQSARNERLKCYMILLKELKKLG